MHELAAVWTRRKGRRWILVSALLYVLVLIPFSQLQWEAAGIPVRPAAMLPVILGILFGPAAAWGLGLGNIAGDFFGSWSPMSIPGFCINFLYPYLSYLLWHWLMSGHAVRLDRYSLGCFIITAIVSTLFCMALLAATGTLLFSRPFESKFVSYAGNNLVWSLTAGGVLYWLVLEKAVRNGCVCGRKWREKLPPQVT